eukprot:m.19322 g.19322  ORF g.19322 m.19322 type:complete len:118 (-) comp8444_c0_seq2:182-535(-)
MDMASMFVGSSAVSVGESHDKRQLQTHLSEFNRKRQNLKSNVKEVRERISRMQSLRDDVVGELNQEKASITVIQARINAQLSVLGEFKIATHNLLSLETEAMSTMDEFLWVLLGDSC